MVDTIFSVARLQERREFVCSKRFVITTLLASVE
jgi:hypothetical protein